MKHLFDAVTLAWLALVVSGAVLLIRRRRRPGFILLGVALAAMLIEASGIPARLLARLERPWLAPPTIAAEPPLQAIVVCGGGETVSAVSPLGLEFNESSDRPLVAVDLARAHPSATLVLGGGTGLDDHPSESELLKALIERWGLVRNPVEALPPCGDTHDEALRTAELARQRGWTRIALVTSAWHMRRARAVFAGAGLNVIPVAADFRATTSLLKRGRLPGLLPSTDTLVNFNLWLTESVGYLYYRLRGWIA